MPHLSIPAATTLAVILLLSLAGCTTINSTGTGQSAGVAVSQPSLPPDYRQRIVDRIHQDAKDPYTIRDATISAPARRFVGLLNGGEATVVCVRMNAKNSFGAYTGLKAWTFMFDRVGAIARVTEEPTIACGDPAIMFEPFSEIEQISTPAPAPTDTR